MEAGIPQTGSGWHSGIFRELKILIWVCPYKQRSGGLETRREACSHHWRMKFLSGPTGDQAARTGRSMTQRTFLCSSAEILLYPIGHGQTLKDAKQENNMERIGFSINNSANNEDDELTGSSTICREINRRETFEKRAVNCVRNHEKKKSNLLRAERRVGGGQVGVGPIVLLVKRLLISSEKIIQWRAGVYQRAEVCQGNREHL